MYTIYAINNSKTVYVGMTTQTLSKRFAQHKTDAKSGGCSITSNLCQKKKPADLQAFHTKLKKAPNAFTIRKVKTVAGTYAEAHREELKVKRNEFKIHLAI